MAVDKYGLTPKQKKFCDEYLKTGNLQKSAIAAGYSPKTASVMAAENIKKPRIAEYLKTRTEKADKKQIADLTEILTFLTDVVRDDTASKTDRLKAADMRLKSLGAYLERMQADVNATTTINVSLDENGGDTDA